MAAVETSRPSISLFARGRCYAFLVKRRLARFSPAAVASAMRRPARRADVVECYRAILDREPENADAAGGHLHGRPLLKDVVAELAGSSELRARHLRSNLAFDRARDSNYLAKSFRGLQSVQAYYGHYGLLVETLTASALESLITGHAVLYLPRRAGSAHRVVVTATHDRHEEGELQLQVHDGWAALYVLGATIVPGEVFGLADRHVLLISRMQGVRGALLGIREATKAFGDVHPKAVLLAAVQGLATSLGVRTMVVVAARNQLAATRDNPEALTKSYDEFFTAAGAEPWGDGFFRLDLARDPHPPTTGSRAHARRTERRRRTRREIAAAAACEVRQWLKASAAPGPTQPL